MNMSPMFVRSTLAVAVALALPAHALSPASTDSDADKSQQGNLIVETPAVVVPIALTPAEVLADIKKKPAADAPMVDCHPVVAAPATAPVIPADLVSRHSEPAPVAGVVASEVVAVEAPATAEASAAVMTEVPSAMDKSVVAPVLLASATTEEPSATEAETTIDESVEVAPVADEVTQPAATSPEMMAAQAADQKVFFPHIRKLYAAYVAKQSVGQAGVAATSNDELVELTLDQRTERVTVKNNLDTPSVEPVGFFDRALMALGLTKADEPSPAVIQQFEITDAEGVVGVQASPETAELKPIVREDSRDWLLSHREPVNQQLQQWAAEAGWNLVWTLPEVSVGEASVIYRGSFDQALEMILATLYPDNMPVRFTMRDSTKKAEVIHVKTQQE